jgi:hypothetical protein
LLIQLTSFTQTAAQRSDSMPGPIVRPVPGSKLVEHKFPANSCQIARPGQFIMFPERGPDQELAAMSGTRQKRITFCTQTKCITFSGLGTAGVQATRISPARHVPTRQASQSLGPGALNSDCYGHRVHSDVTKNRMRTPLVGQCPTDRDFSGLGERLFCVPNVCQLRQTR